MTFLMSSQSYDERRRHVSTRSEALAQRIRGGSDVKLRFENSQRLSIFRGLLRRMECKSRANPPYSGRPTT
jgi:hypothetical protein